MAEKRTEPKKEKSGRPKAPKLGAAQRIRQSREVAQGKKNYEAWYSFIIAVLTFLLILFVLFGGINQRKFLFAVKDIGDTISEFMGKLINPQALNITDDGVYIDPEALGENIQDAVETKTGENTEQTTEGTGN